MSVLLCDGLIFVVWFEVGAAARCVSEKEHTVLVFVEIGVADILAEVAVIIARNVVIFALLARTGIFFLFHSSISDLPNSVRI